MGKVTQWVNLPKTHLFVSEDVRHLSRIGRVVKFDLVFKKKEVSEASFRLIGAKENATYTATEVARSPRFSPHPTQGTGLTNTDGVLRVIIEMPAAGGDEFHLQGTKSKFLSKDEVVTSDDSVVTARTLYYQSVPMVGVVPPDITHVKKYFWEHARIRLVEVPRKGTLPWCEVLSSNAYDVYSAMEDREKDITAYGDVAFTIFWVNHMADSQWTTLLNNKMDVTLAPDASHGLEIRLGSYLWQGFGAQDLAAADGKGWLSSVTCTFKQQGASAAQEVPISRPAVRLSGPPLNRGRQAGYSKISVDLPPSPVSMRTHAWKERMRS